MPRSATKRQPARAELGALPEWDLADLYPAPDSPLLRQDLERAYQDDHRPGVLTVVIGLGRWRGTARLLREPLAARQPAPKRR